MPGLRTSLSFAELEVSDIGCDSEVLVGVHGNRFWVRAEVAYFEHLQRCVIFLSKPNHPY